MRAKLISEKFDFERGRDPKEVLDIGIKKEFFQYFPKSLEDSVSHFYKIWKRVKAVINDPKTQVIFSEENISRSGRPTEDGFKNHFMTIKLDKGNPLNPFFFQTLAQILNSHSPIQLYQTTSEEENDDEKTYYIPNF